MNYIEAIPLGNIKPFKGQPRTYFDPAGLEELATSIRAHGQLTPAWVLPLGEGQYELIAGERRWRACQMAGCETLLCEVRSSLDLEHQYIASIMENFGRRDCTTMETARAIGNMLKVYDGNYAKVATVFSRSEAWVRNLSALLKLHPDVARLLEPPNPKLMTPVAIALSGLKEDVQVKLANNIVRRGLKLKAALSHIRVSIKSEDRVSKHGMRSPNKDFKLISSFLNSLGPQAQSLLDLGEERLNLSFVYRAPKDKRVVCRVLAQRIKQLEKLLAALSA